MRRNTHCQNVLVDTGGVDEQGCLLFVDERLVAVLVRLERDDELKPELWGRWFVEAGFGPCQQANSAMTFASTDEAIAWACEQVAQAGTHAPPLDAMQG
ncbi:MAG: hypothetical protein K2X71_09540 [Methylobacterium sp.]|uniref:hypothetical protein n=1 Tax=Methylobacterium sp. TaxID=409 RepID=UPI0025871E78|nr:hypothetical protein [Methylobacterium sp.]MBY0296264.1 hypothetical protein [Methylobacterium sp.]